MSRRDTVIGSVIASTAVLVLVGLAVLPRYAQRVEEQHPSPGFLWSAKYPGWHCQLDEHHIVMSDDETVWSLDLRDGSTPWRVDLDGRAMGQTCLPDAGLVALTAFRDTGGAQRQDTRVLDGATGDERHRLPAEEAVSVLDLGPVIGLLDEQNVLTAVAPTALASPLWSASLPASSQGSTYAESERIGDDFVAVTYTIDDGSDEGVERRLVLGVADGEAPAWASTASEENVVYQLHEGVALRWSGDEEGQRLTALDENGRELWHARDVQTLSSGSRLYLLDMAKGYSGYTGVRLVDPRTGTTRARFTERCDRVTELPGGRIGLISETRWISVDADLVEDNRQPMTRKIFEFVDEDHMFLGNFTTGDHERVMALRLPDGDVVWEKDLVPDQRLDRIGAHLVVTDDDRGAIHGLEGPA